MHLSSYSKARNERNDLKAELLIKREAELKDLEQSQPKYFERNEKACL